MSLEEMLVRALNIDEEKAWSILKSRSTKRFVYKDIIILSFKREMLGYPEGTSVVFDPSTKSAKVVPGYPPIPRLLLIEKVKDLFSGEVIVEEKLNGYNVRIANVNGRVLSLTRGGNVCPYTHYKLMTLYGDNFKRLFESHPDAVVYGEAIGIDNPYVRYHSYKDISFDYVVFDILSEGAFLPIQSRNELAERFGLRLPRSFGYYEPGEYMRILHLTEELEGKGVEGVVIKSLDGRKRAKYTTTHTNVGDIEEGMRFFFEEGKTYIFPRLLREIFRQYELRKAGRAISDKVYCQFGKALLEPSIQVVEKTENGEITDEDFTLRVSDLKILDEFLSFMETQKIPIHVAEIYKTDNGEYKVHCLKVRRTPLKIKKILETGISPED